MSTATSNRRHHRAVLLLSLALLAVAVLLRIDESGRVELPLINVSMPTVCGWRWLTGCDCPFCGLTRCFVAAAHGSLGEAWRFHPTGVLLFLVVVAQLPYRAVQLRRIKQSGRES